MLHKFVFLNGILVLMVSMVSFTLSYFALRDLSTQYLYHSYPYLALFWPLLIDFSLIVFSISIIAAKVQKDSVVKHWILVLIYTILTLTFNIVHAPDNLLSKVIAAIPPISLLFSFEIFLHQLISYKLFGPKEITYKEPIEEPIYEEPIINPPELNLSKFRKDKRIKLEKLIKLKNNPNLTLNEIAKKLKVSNQTLDTYMRDLEVLNGHFKI